uniref:Protein kinase domain-containing protein n=1 Tax=Oryza brachyantha TaxID=4533 RepID=J3N0Z6_ORYBR
MVGQGAFGVVVRAQDRRTGKNVALKGLLGVDDGARFAPDFDALRVDAACQHAYRGHPSIVEVKNVVSDGKTGEIFLVMEFVGSSLREEMPRARPEDLVRAMMRQLDVAAKKMHDSRSSSPATSAMARRGHVSAGMHNGRAPHRRATVRRRHDKEELLIDLSDNLGDLLRELFEDVLPELSPAVREVVSGLLAFDPEKRLTTAEAMEHRWFAQVQGKQSSLAFCHAQKFTPNF